MDTKTFLAVGVGMLLALGGLVYAIWPEPYEPPEIDPLTADREALTAHLQEVEENMEPEPVQKEKDNLLDQVRTALEDGGASPDEHLAHFRLASLLDGRDHEKEATKKLVQSMHSALSQRPEDLRDLARKRNIYYDQEVNIQEAPDHGEEKPSLPGELPGIPDMIPSGAEEFLETYRRIESRMGEEWVQARVERYIDSEATTNQNNPEQLWGLALLAEVAGLNSDKARDLARDAHQMDKNILGSGFYLDKVWYGTEWIDRGWLVSEMEEKQEQWEFEQLLVEEFDEEDWDWRRRAREHIQQNRRRHGRETVVDASLAPWVFYMEDPAEGEGATDLFLSRFVNEMENFIDDFTYHYEEYVNEEELREHVMPMYIFRENGETGARERYIREKEVPPFAGGHFAPEGEDRGWVFTFYDSSNPPSLTTTLYHEGVHQLVNFVSRSRGGGDSDSNTFWFSEGLATFFEIGKRTETEDGEWIWEFGDFSDDKYGPWLQQSFQEDNILELKEIFGSSYSDFREGMAAREYDTQNWYAHAWSIVYFFHEYEGGKYKGAFEEYIHEELSGSAGESPMESFKKFFPDPEKIEKEWKEFYKDELNL